MASLLTSFYTLLGSSTRCDFPKFSFSRSAHPRTQTFERCARKLTSLQMHFHFGTHFTCSQIFTNTITDSPPIIVINEGYIDAMHIHWMENWWRPSIRKHYIKAYRDISSGHPCIYYIMWQMCVIVAIINFPLTWIT